MKDVHARSLFSGTKRLAKDSPEAKAHFWGVISHVSEPPHPTQNWMVIFTHGPWPGDWASLAWSASCEGYIPQKVKAQIEPLCEMSTVPSKVLWNFSAVLAYVGHLEIKWNRNNVAIGNLPAAPNPESLIWRLLLQLWTNALLTHRKKPHLWLLSWSNQLWGLQGLCQEFPFPGTLSMMEANPSTMEIGLKLARFRCPEKAPCQSTLI